MDDLTRVIRKVHKDAPVASEELLPLVYDELRRLAAIRMAQESAGQTLQPTALVHEAWLQLSSSGDRLWDNRAHFFCAATNAMRRILIDKARRRSRLKYGGGLARLDIDELDLGATTPDDNVLLVDEAVEALKKEDPQQAQVVMLKFFAGLTNGDAAQSLGVSERTVRRQWECAKLWIFQWIHDQRG